VITLVVAQLTVSLILVGRVLAGSGLQQGPLLIVAIGLAVMVAAAVTIRPRIARARRPTSFLMEENT